MTGDLKIDVIEVNGRVTQANVRIALGPWPFKNWSHVSVHCESLAGGHRAVRVGEPKPDADELNPSAAMDLLCGECRFVVATLHEEVG